MDDEHFSEHIYTRYEHELTNYATTILADRHLAEDAVAEAFLSAWRAFNRGATPAHERAWLYAIVRNTCLTIRSRQSTVPVEIQESDLVSSDGADATADHQMQIERISRALGQFEKRDQQIFILREVRGLSYAEIAAHLGCTLHSVEYRLYRVRKRLQYLKSDASAA